MNDLIIIVKVADFDKASMFTNITCNEQYLLSIKNDLLEEGELQKLIGSVILERINQESNRLY